MATARRYARRIWLDGLTERQRESVLQDRAEVRDETIFGLEPRRWGQVALLFNGEKGSDVLYCLARGLSTHAAALYLGISERTVRNVLNGFLSKLQSIKTGSGGQQAQMFEMPDLHDEFAPDRRAPTRRGRPRRQTPVEAQSEKTVEMCYSGY